MRITQKGQYEANIFDNRSWSNELGFFEWNTEYGCDCLEAMKGAPCMIDICVCVNEIHPQNVADWVVRIFACQIQQNRSISEVKINGADRSPSQAMPCMNDERGGCERLLLLSRRLMGQYCAISLRDSRRLDSGSQTRWS